MNSYRDATALIASRLSDGKTERTIRFIGTAKDGRGRTGQATTDDLQAWVHKRYLSGWRRLVVMQGGIEVGGIDVRPRETGRYWWAES